ncbi:MAG: ATP-binding protein [Nanoarchaeota archaeon]|nr:ATP-binding protein [Nanoarchaeota archaeon]MBU1976554.1 ATP-binding protein [Nanoarchaeota archaeon]
MITTPKKNCTDFSIHFYSYFNLFILMTFDVIIGRSKRDVAKYGKRGTVLIGKQYVKMGQTTSLSNPVYMDVAGAHVVFIVGKRGSGKSYTMGAIAEGLADLPLEIKQNLSIVLLDTMGIYWTMKYPNFQDAELVKQWGFTPRGLDVKIYTPSGFYYKYQEEGIPTDFPFSLRPIDVEPHDWCNAFNLDPNSAAGVLITRIVQQLKKKEQSYELDELIDLARNDADSDKVTISVVVNQLEKAKGWEIFSKEGTALKEIIAPGQVTVLDVSPYATIASGWEIKALVVAIITRTLFQQRMLARKTEEFKSVDAAMHYFKKDVEEKMEDPLVWVAIDEAHELLPHDGKTAASEALITILREGRQPGISLILATQQPAKIHTDVMTQSDTVIAHRLTAKMDTEALKMLMQSYMRKGLDEEIDSLPRVKGAAVLFDDANESLFPVQMRPRFTWHGGGSPIAIKERKDFFSESLKKLKEL